MKTKEMDDVRVFYSLNRKLGKSSRISHHFFFKERCLMGYYPEAGGGGEIYFTQDPQILEELGAYFSSNFEKIRENAMAGRGMIFYLGRQEADMLTHPFENIIKMPFSYRLAKRMMPDILDELCCEMQDGINNLMKLVFEEKI